MNLVNELQISAEQDDVLTVLRKAKRLASKLGVDDINHWLRCDQEGYATGQAIPKYRTVLGSLVFKTNGPIPMGMGMVGQGVMDYPGNFTVDRMLPDSMGEIISIIRQCRQKNHSLYLPLDQSNLLRQLRGYLHPTVAGNVSFLLKLNTGQVRAIPEAVKDRVLEWACGLERRGVLGDNMTFSDKERAIAHSITFNLNNCQVGRLNNIGQNKQGAD